MPKRHRTSSSSGSGDPVNHEISLLHSGIFSQLSERSLDAVGSNGNKEVIIRSKTKGHFGKVGPKMYDIYNMLFPHVSIKYKGYGKLCTGAVSGTTSTLCTLSTTAAKSVANFFNGKQGFFTFAHLSYRNALSYDSTTFNVNDLLATVCDAQNVAKVSDYTVPPTVTTGSPLTSLQGKYRSLYYQGGYTEHIFYNPGNEEINFECWEVRPKRFLLSNETPLATLCLDKQVQGAKLTGYPSINPTTAVREYMQPENPDFTVGVHDHMFHDKFTCSQSKTVKVLGGETVKVFVKHPGWSLTGAAELNSMLYGNYVEQTVSGFDTARDLDYLPFCTVWLMVRIHGQIVTDDKGNDTVTKVNIGPCQLAHLQREVHNARAGFTQNANQIVEKNGWTDSALGVDPNQYGYIDNPLIDEPTGMRI